ncbi:MAG: hydrogenase formation protein HypD [Lachnospiraceae bacterium]|nr:hydrogenase formation protein HypD [Lachnospiraceae bacterium]
MQLVDSEILRFLKEYDGDVIRIMEVCGTHTAEISRTGIRKMLSPKIKLISGPGCPVCVTVTAYIDACIEIAKRENTTLVSFGDMLRVPGSHGSLRDAQAEGASVKMVYSPLDTLKYAKEHPETMYVFAAVGFETTTPVYALLMEQILAQQITNIKLLTSLKVMPPVIDWVCANQGNVDGFLAPGHVSVITGSRIFAPLAEKFHLPFVVSGFEGEELLSSIYALIKLRGQGTVMNLYPSVVSEEGNTLAQAQVEKYFTPGDATWRGMGSIPDSGMYLRETYQKYDAGSLNLIEDHVLNRACRCAEVLTGKITSEECPLFGTACTTEHPQGACMVSMEGACFNHLTAR